MEKYRCWKRPIALLLTLSIGASIFGAGAEKTAAPDVSARAAIAVEGSTGTVLYEKNADEHLAMASTTKIMTALLAVERGSLDETVVIPRTYPEAEGSSIYLRPGEKMTLRELLLGLMLHSGNDAAVAVAEHIAGTTEDFVALMNQRAAELGMTNTSFATPNGLDDDTHYSTARDMATLACCALKNSDFVGIVSTKQAVIPGEGGTDRYLKNSNRMLFEYEGAVGVKTGYTKKAGRCLVSAAQRDGRLIVVVTLCDPDDWYDHTALLDYGFSRTVSHTAVRAGDIVAEVPVIASPTASVGAAALDGITLTLLEEETDDVRCELLLPRFVYAPVRAQQPLGELRVWVGDRLAGTVTLMAASACEQLSRQLSFWERLLDFFSVLFT